MARTSRSGDRDREIGLEITSRRKSAGLSQEALGSLLGLSHQQIAKYERGENSLRVTLWEEIDRILAINTPGGFAEPQSTFRPPPVRHPAKDELLRSADLLEAEARRLRTLSDTI